MANFPYNTLVKFTQSGSEAQIWTAAGAINYPPAANTVEGTYDVRGDYSGGGCYAAVEVTYAGGPYGNGAAWYCNLPENSTPAISYAVVQGDVNVYWNRRKWAMQSWGVQSRSS